MEIMAGEGESAVSSNLISNVCKGMRVWLYIKMCRYRGDRKREIIEDSRRKDCNWAVENDSSDSFFLKLFQEFVAQYKHDRF